MNPGLALLRPYPFERLRSLLASVEPSPEHRPVNLSIGEPKHPTPDLITRALVGALDGLSQYPATKGRDALREAIAGWIARRYRLGQIDPQRQVLPVNGSREALFSAVQALVDPALRPLVVMPNPGYQIYEGAALLAGARPVYLPTTAAGAWRLPLDRLDDAHWRQVALVFACSPGNPTGHVMGLDEWRELFELSDRYGFLIAADECYAEIFQDEAAPPLGSLEAARRLGRDDFRGLLSFNSLSKRSNVPGLRSGFVAGDAALIDRFLAYRTYPGSAMGPAVQAASVAAWLDEAHVIDNRLAYRLKFAAAHPSINRHYPCELPDASFYLWAQVGTDDAEFAASLYRSHNVLVLPGSYLARSVDGCNPGEGYVRIALVAPAAEVNEAIDRIHQFAAAGGVTPT